MFKWIKSICIFLGFLLTVALFSGNKVYAYNICNLELGAIDGTNGKEAESTNRGRTEKYDLSQTEVKVNVGNSGARYGVFFYDTAGNYVSWTGWTTGDIYTVPDSASYSRVVLCYPDNRTIGRNELEILSGCVTINEVTEKYAIKLGAIDGTNGKEAESTNRGRTEKYDLSQTEVKVNVGNSGARYGVFFYDTAGNYISWTGWTTGSTYIVPDSASYSRVVLCYPDNHAIGRSELKILSGCITTNMVTEKYSVKLGAIDGTNGKEVESTNRGRTEKYDLSQTEVKVNVGNSGARYGVFFYDTAGNYISWTGWTTESAYTVPDSASYARVVLCYPNNCVIGRSELKILSGCVAIESVVEKYEVELGTLGSNGELVLATNRTRTEKYDLSQINIKVNVGDSGARYAVFFYDTYNKYINWTGWKTETLYSIPNNASYARVVLCYIDNRELGSNELKTLSRCVTKEKSTEKYLLELGTLGSNGEMVLATNRGRTEKYDLRQVEIKVNAETSGVKYAVFFYDIDDKYVKWSGWKTEKLYTVPENAMYARIVLCYTDNRILGRNELRMLSDYVTIKYINTSSDWELPIF